MEKLEKIALVITSINKPNEVIKKYYSLSKKNKVNFIIIGDKKTPKYPSKYNFYNLKSQKNFKFTLNKSLPINSYSRKNIGFLVAMYNDSKIIMETDDDNFPKSNFFKNLELQKKLKLLSGSKWINIFKIFQKKNKDTIWPRGFPLDEINEMHEIKITKKLITSPIQQRLCDGNPDVDAIFRLLNSKIKIKFKNTKVSLSKSISPFNSQNTIWHKNIFELMYLPVTCPMRCTDIWRSLITLKIMQLNNLDILFYGTNIFQSRNLHNLMDDFYEEVPLYLESKKIIHILNKIKLKKGFKNFSFNIYKCYEILIKNQIFNKTELTYLKAWLDDCKKLI